MPIGRGRELQNGVECCSARQPRACGTWRAGRRKAEVPEPAADAQHVVHGLDAMLRLAASTRDWTRDVVHRCAWCSQVVTGTGQVDPAAASAGDSTRVETHGMCEACATRALAQLAARPRRLRPAA